MKQPEGAVAFLNIPLGTVPVMFGPNITGACGVTRFIYQNGEFVEPSGPFYQWDDEKFEMQAGNGVDVYRQAMDASRVSAIYRSVSTVQPPALLSLVCIKI